MHMVGHPDIASDRPAMAIMGISPLVNQYCCDFFSGQNRSSLESAGGDEIDRPVDPDTLEPAQMLMHSRICSPHRRAELNNPRYSRPGSPIPATTLSSSSKGISAMSSATADCAPTTGA